jgi:hypothetical protein
MTTPRNRDRRPELFDQHQDLVRLLPADDREWLARMADVLPWGWVVSGMALPARAGVVVDRTYPGGVRVVCPPAGSAGQSPARPSRPSPTVGVLR